MQAALWPAGRGRTYGRSDLHRPPRDDAELCTWRLFLHNRPLKLTLRALRYVARVWVCLRFVKVPPPTASKLAFRCRRQKINECRSECRPPPLHGHVFSLRGPLCAGEAFFPLKAGGAKRCAELYGAERRGAPLRFRRSSSARPHISPLVAFRKRGVYSLAGMGR